MTAIAYRAGVLVVDSLVNSGPYICGTTKKWAKDSDGSLAAAAGSASECYTFLKAFADGDPYDTTKFNDEFSGIIVRFNGPVTILDHLGEHLLDSEWYADGSAYGFLQGAMAAGASAEEAVHLATKHIAGIGGEIKVLRLGENTE